jgi:pyridoxamine 5'-phosphate oxidase
MIDFKSKKYNRPIARLKDIYFESKNAGQKNIEALCLSTSGRNQKPSSRLINIKYITENSLIFFSNYDSKKAKDIKYNNNISGVFFWNNINVQIRLEGIINKLEPTESNEHFAQRSSEKNVLAISSSQSNIIKSYDEVVKKYNTIINNKHAITQRPSYWGGYEIKPSYYEFWYGHKNRLNKRVAYIYENDKWNKFYLEP